MLTQFIDSLRRCPPREQGEKAFRALFDSAVEEYYRDRQPLVARAGEYTRTCAYLDGRFEVLLLNWAPGSSSPLHDHGAEHCWMVVLEGRLLAENYERIDGCDVPRRAVVLPRETIAMGIGDLDLRRGALDLHRISAADRDGAISLHVYAKPLREFMIYDEFAQTCRPGTTRYDAVLPFVEEVIAS